MKRHALFVGVDNYADPTIQNLKFPSEDAGELASVFRRLLKFDRVEKLVNPDHSPAVVDAVKDMTRGLGPGDLFLFFFAGHGFRVRENHVLVCAKDEYADLEDEYTGLPVGQLKRRMRGPWNRMLVLDACQNDIRATRGADAGVTSRDLELIHAVEGGGRDAGFQIVVTSCSEGQKSLEVADLRHGLFTSAFLDSVTSFADARRRIDLESLRRDLGNRMGGLIDRYRLAGRQEPMFSMPANASGLVLLDGASSPPLDEIPPLVVCPDCGLRHELKDTFRCRVCGRDYLCLDHYDKSAKSCSDCAEKARREAAERKAREEAEAIHGKQEHGRVQLWAGGPYWAEMNVGAGKPEDCGLYFWWGDTVGYRREGDAWIASDGCSSRNFEFDLFGTPTIYKDTSTLRRGGWITPAGVLAPTHDAAHVHWGGGWRMPTKQELSDLAEKCDWEWTTKNGVKGYVVSGRGTYADASIFLPAVGCGNGTSLAHAGSYGHYWLSVPSSDDGFSWSLYFNSDGHGTDDGFYRFLGKSIRPVQGIAE